jgi:DNA-directed RNA polymerase specialized sigma24 family protein
MSKTYFISSDKNDLAWAEWIAWIVEDLGFQAIMQAWDFTPGKSWTQEMQEATKNSDATICILTDDFLNSGFTAAEWQSAFADDPTGEKRKIIPIRVKPCAPDGLLKTRIYADLVGKDKNSAKDIVKCALLEGRRKPSTEPVFPPDHGKEPDFPKSKIKYSLVLDAEFDESSKEKVNALIQHLQKKLQDPSITITEISEGSVIIQIESTYDTFSRLQKEFLEEGALDIEGNRVVGIWKIGDGKESPVNQRLELYRSRLVSFFLSKGADKETAKDLAQDVIFSLISDENKYKYLSSSALTINLARLAFSKCVQEKDREAIARRGYVSPTGEIDWDEVYGAAIKVLNNLSAEEHFILEQFWDSKFAEGKFDHILDKEQARQIDESVERDIYINFVDDDYENGV